MIKKYQLLEIMILRNALLELVLSNNHHLQDVYCIPHLSIMVDHSQIFYLLWLTSPRFLDHSSFEVSSKGNKKIFRELKKLLVTN